ncbi:nuclear transport factor 2 family protein [Xanthobacter oligotrophicus]|uniref:nuclear transport factor 2 family protein n=1 Tax=Xanthobacter oligotrophicus TaxID=2607286 RepID=UPI0011F401F0|nr:nuclear transport factor 2 family protein [Xanthobacter oligotrophicus]MCG5236174.1 nuclear transport factor 2 family protein [Xanthobacter oligotrophicus]
MPTDADIPSLIRDLEERRYAAMLDADIPTLDALLSDQLVYTHSNATVDGKASYLAKVADKYFDYLDIAHPEEQLILNGSAVLVIGRMTARVVVEGKTQRHLNNRTLTVWVREGEAWRVAAFQPTPIPQS